MLSNCNQKEEKEPFIIGFSQCCDDPWRDVMNGEMQRELGLHPEVRFEMRLADNNSERQINQIRELVDSGIDILLVSPNESKPLTPIIEDVYKRGIPVILIDRKTNSRLYSAYIGANNYEIGKTAAQYISSKVSQAGNIIEIHLPFTISPSIERNRGFQDEISSYPELNVVGQINALNAPQDIVAQLPRLLQKYPEANVIFAHTDFLAETAYEVAENLGRAEDMFFVGIDGIPGTGRGIQAVEDGILDASLLYPTGGGEAIRLALGVLNNLPYEKENKLETIVIEEGNARILHNQMKKVASLQENIDAQLRVLEASRIASRNLRTLIFVLISSLLLAIVLGIFLWKSLRINKAALKNLELKNQKITENEQQLLTMSDEVKKATQAKVDFFTNISHEFRTPLTLIVGFAEDLLPSRKLGKEVQQSLSHIRQNAFRLLRLVNQLMDFRKVESNQMKLQASENDLVAFIRSIMESFGQMAKRRNLDLQLITRQESLSVWFDVGMMDKVLFNLFSNAFKFTPDGGKIHVTLSVDNFENAVKLTVEDTGLGISESDVKHIFEPFFQGTEQQMAGTGLGLSLSKSLVDIHRGEISVQSALGKGSRFIIALPLGNQHLQEEEMLNEQIPFTDGKEIYLNSAMDFERTEEMAENGIAASQQILLIEDNEDLQFFLKNKLIKTYQVIQATGGEEGIQKAFEFIPDLIISDVMLPGTGGLEIVQTLKSDLRTSHIPIILLTAQSTIDQQIKGTEMGADAYITKPFNVHFLLVKIKSLLLNREIVKNSYDKQLITHEVAYLETELPNKLSSMDREFLRKFAAYVAQNYDRQEFQVNDLCEAFSLSRSQLYRKVKALLGESISDYIQNVRLKKAEQLLLNSNHSVADIAYQVGYSSPDYFSTVFRSRYGISPTAFRKDA